MPKPASNVTSITPATAESADHQLAILQGLGQEAQSALQAFTKRASSGTPFDVPELTRQVADLFSIVVDLATGTTSAHKDHYEWGGEVDDELDRLGDLVEGDTSRLTPTDAGTLKATLTALMALLPTDASTDAVKTRGLEAIAFIDEVTITEGDEDEEDEEDGDEGEEEDEETES